MLIDQLVWRPAIAWSDKFKFEQVESARNAVLSHPQPAAQVQPAGALPQIAVWRPCAEASACTARQAEAACAHPPSRADCGRSSWPRCWRRASLRPRLCLFGGRSTVARGSLRAELISALRGAGATFLRVMCRSADRLAVDHSRGRRHRLQSAGWPASRSRLPRWPLRFRRRRCSPSCSWR